MKGIVTMKMLIVHLGMLLFFITTSVNAANVNGRFLITGVENSRISVLLQINTNTGSDDMGGATLVLGFDKSLINIPDLPQLNTDYLFHNFSGGNYNLATITKPADNMVWLNIDLPYSNSNNGTVVSGSSGWTDVATIYFNLVNGSDSVSLKWLTASTYWGIYDADNTTLWTSGNFTNLETKIINDNTAPVLLNANLTDPTTLELIFSESLESTSALNKLNYVINNGVSVLNVTLSNNNTQATIKTTVHTAGSSYNILIQNIFDPAGNLISPTNNPAEYYCEAPPALTNLTEIIVNNTQTLTLKFSNKMDAASVTNKNNYSSSLNINIITVQLLPDTMGVVLKTSKHSDDTQYTLTIVNVKDRAGNYIAPNPGSHLYRTPKKGKGNTKRDIEIANSPSWFQDLTPEKTIDGQGMTTSTSRWQSGTSMPSDIDYDLGEGFTLDSLRTSFYKWEAGRIYQYSVYISNDSLNWVPAVEEVWSEYTEWTELKFEPVETRYLRLVMIQSNQGNTSSLWEVEAFGGDNVTNATGTNENPIPENFALMQNYPNPFNPSTVISYQLSVNGNVKLAVYDILGNEVASLVDEEKAAGRYEVRFDATGLASGVYVYRLIAENQVETKKMVLLR
ncbi:MAG: discoidin domain-containing protein [Ignavibacteriaceae bacterium]